LRFSAVYLACSWGVRVAAYALVNEGYPRWKESKYSRVAV
jgi:hypothetical protein